MSRPSAVFASSLVRILMVASLAFVHGCAKQVPPQGPDAARVEPPSPPRAGGQTGPDPQPQPGKPDPGPIETPPPKPATPGRLQEGQTERQVGARISTYYLSAGDQIRISVYGYPDLDRTVKIPPDAHIFFPMIGDIAVDGMSIPELRKIIADGLRAADEQRIGSGDLIVVRVYRNDDLSITTTVPSSGRVNLPLAGEMDLAGLTVEGASQAIAGKLVPYVVKPSVSTTIQKSAAGLPGRITDPHVSVEVLAFGGHKVLVLGEVRNPGVYVDEGGSRLLEMLARAGGPTDDAKLTNVALVRLATETSPARTALLNLERVIKGGELDQNPPIQRGDIIYVPKTTIANVARFFRYVYDVVRPFVAVEQGVWLGQNIEAGPNRANQPNVVPVLSFPSP